MCKFKLSILVRSSQLIINYKKTHNCDFWDAFLENLKKELDSDDISCEAGGSFQHQYSLSFSKDKSDLSKATRQALANFLSEEECNLIIVSIAQYESERSEEKAEDASEENKVKSKIFLSDAYTKKKPPILLEKEETKQEAPNDNDIASLLDQAKKIDALKTGLLNKVKGQRHAVDEVVQGIFECEMFASHDENRKGPLATFLFTGPSGVGKTFLASQCGKLLGRKMLVVNMSEYSDNLANMKFNGEHGQAAVVTGFVRQHPDGIIVFDEIEKAHINTIHLFLQILDAATLMDHHLKKDVSFRNNIIIMTTNAGKSLYDDTTVCDLSSTPRSVILEALRTDKNPQTGEPYFPECITTRMANGHVILFNHLEPYSLMEIISGELKQQIGLFEKTSGIKVEYDIEKLSALVLYNGGGMADARTLRGLARSILVRELQEIVMQIYANDQSMIGSLQTLTLNVDINNGSEAEKLFSGEDNMYVSVFTSGQIKNNIQNLQISNTVFEAFDDSNLFKRRIRGITDYILHTDRSVLRKQKHRKISK